MKSILALSFGCTLAAVITILAFVVIGGENAEAASYTLTSTTPVTNWSDLLRWNGGTGLSYPGQSAGDSVTIALPSTINIDVAIANPVVLNISSGAVVTIPSGGKIVLASSSSAQNTDTFTVNGGTLGVDSAATLTSWAGPITINSGTLDVQGSISLLSSNTFTLAGGTVQGGGTITIPSSGTANFTGSSGAMTLTNVTFKNGGTTTFSGSNPLAINSAAIFNNQSGATFSLQASGAINTDNVSAPAITNAGTMSRSAAGTSTINVEVDNSGTINPSSGTIELLGGGTQTGTFTLASSTSTIRFNGVHAINAGSAITAGALGTFELAGGTLNVNTPITVPKINMTAGTLAGSSTLTTSSAFDWAGGNQDGSTGGSTALGTSTLTIDPTSAVTLNARTISGSGAWTYAPGAGGSLNLTNSAQMNTTGGTFDLQSDTTISGDSTSTINILGGTLSKTTGTKTTVACPLNINGTGSIAPTGKTIAFGSGGSIGGTSVTVNTSISGAQLEFSGGTTALNGGTTITSGNFLISGGTLTINSSNTVSTLNESAGTLNGTQTLTAGTLNFTGGTMSGSGTLTVVTTGNVNGSSPTILTNGWTLNNIGTIHYAPSSSLAVNSGAMISNSGTWSLENNASITSDLTSGPKFSNNLTLSKNVGGTTAIGVPFLNGAAITLSGGSVVAFNGGGQDNGATTSLATANDGLQFLSTYNIAATPAITGSGFLDIASGGTLNVNAATTAPNVKLAAGGTLGGSATLTIGSSLKWTGGTMNGNGTTAINAGAIADLTALTAAPAFASRTITNAGTINYNPTFPLTFNGSATLSNNGVMNITSAGTTASSGVSNTISNSGTINKTAGANTFTFNVAINNSGTFDEQVAGGTFAFTGGGTNTGTMSASVANGVIELASGAYTFNESFVVTGTPAFGTLTTLLIDGGTLQFDNSLAAPASFQMTSGQLGPHIGAGTGSLILGSGTAATISGGTLLQATIQPNSGSSIIIDTTTNPVTFDAGVLSISTGATATWNGSQQWMLANGASVSIGGTFNWTGAGTIASSGTTPSIGVSGTLNKTTSTGTIGVAAKLQNGGGTISAQAGVLQLNYNGVSNHAGTFDASSGAEIDLGGNGGTSILTSVTGIGAGLLRFLGGIVTLQSNTTLTNLALDQATINGPGALTFTGTLDWKGGTLNAAATNSGGTLNLLGTLGTMTLGANLSSGANFSSPTNALSIGSGATFTNTGTFVATGAAPISGSGTLTNSGTFTKTTATSTAISTVFNNNGTTNITNGTLTLSGNGTDGGTYLSAAPGVLAFTGGTRTVTGTFTPGGAVNISGGSLALNTSGTATMNGVTISGGTLTGSSALQINGTNAWTSGTISGTGSLTIPSGSTLNIGSGAGAILDARTITNAGTVNVAGAANTFELDNGATLKNQATGVVDLQNDVSLINASGADSVLNAGTFKKTCCTGTTPIAGTFNNTGSLLANAGTINFGSFTQASGTTNLNGGNVTSLAVMNYTGGTLIGSGSVGASLTNSGATIDPGASLVPGTITIGGTFNQTGAGTLIADLFANASNDLLDAPSDVVNLGGTLKVQLAGAYSPVTGDTFTVLNHASPLTDTSTKIYPTFGPNNTGFFTATASGSAITLATTVPSADLATTAAGLPGPATHNALWFPIVNVNNLGTFAATNVQVTLTTTNAVIVSAGAPGFSCSGTGANWTCTAASFASGASATILMNVTPTAVGTFTLASGVTATEADPNFANNASSASWTVVPGADLGLTITDSPNPVNAGQLLTYSYKVTNNGPDPSSFVLTFDVTGGTQVNAPGCIGTTCSGTLAAFTSQTFPVTLMPPPNVPAMTGTGQVFAIGIARDQNTANDIGIKVTTVIPNADLKITKTLTGSLTAGQNATYSISVQNLGPSDAANVTIADPTPAGLTFVSSSGACASQTFPCNIGTLTAGSTTTFGATFAVAPTAAGTIANSASVSSSILDPSTANNSATATASVVQSADVSVTKSGPASVTAQSSITYTINVRNNGPSTATNVILTDPTPSGLSLLSINGGGCTTFPCSLGAMTSGQTITVTAAYAIASQTATSFTNTASVSTSTADPVASNNTSSVTTSVSCPSAPSLIGPINGTAIATPPVHFSWSLVAGATTYEVFVSNGGPSTSIGTTSTTSLDAILTNDGAYTWFVVATVPGCGKAQSSTGSFAICGTPGTPQPSVVAESSSGQSYTLTWPIIPSATKYEVDEASDAAFTSPTTSTVTTSSASFTHSTSTTPQTFFYRVRAFAGCAQKFGSNSDALRVVVIPLPSPNEKSPNVNVPAGSKQLITQQLFIPGIAGGNFSYSATTDEPWVTVTPSTGVLTPDGVTLTLTTDPANLPNGTFTSTVIVTLTPIGATSTAAHPLVTTVVSVPVSVSLVTPVQPGGKSAPPANALIIPSVGHLDGIASHWQSDIRVSNTGNAKQNYALTFTASDGSVKQTTIAIDAGVTTALDDIVKNWYGVGSVGDAASGILELHPVDAAGRPVAALDAPSQSLTTVASSRTYNVATTGTLGQFIPALPFASFVGRGASVLSMQQIAQSDAYRTNFGIIEAAGQPVTALLSVFDDAGKNLKDIPLTLNAFQQLQLNSLLASNNISLSDGRVEVKVTGGDGKIASFASVVDNLTNDPLLVTGTPVGATANHFVLPGVADISNGLANWRTDMRVFNSGAQPQSATFTFYPLGDTTNTFSTTTTLQPGEVKTFDNILQSLFNHTNIGGALHVTTSNAAPLIVSGRTYNQTSNGTYGQFIGAVTSTDAIGANERSLQILQVEDSPRYRTNIGIAEVTGQPATVEMSIVLPDSRITPKLTIPLKANEYRQFSPAIELGLGNMYNARIAIKVTSGSGRVTAYGSVIDMATQDPTYVPAQ